MTTEIDWDHLPEKLLDAPKITPQSDELKYYASELNGIIVELSDKDLFRLSIEGIKRQKSFGQPYHRHIDNVSCALGVCDRLGYIPKVHVNWITSLHDKLSKYKEYLTFEEMLDIYINAGNEFLGYREGESASGIAFIMVKNLVRKKRGIELYY